MADKSKMSVADILAAARKTDGSGESAGAPAADDTNGDSAAPAESAAQPEAEVGDAGQEAAAAPASVPKSGAGRPSVADMLAMARGEKKSDAAPAAEQPAAKAAPKPAAKPAAPAAKKESPKAAPKPAKTGPVDTQSILAAARKSSAAKPGPMTKAEAAAKGVAVAPAKPKKAKTPKEEVVVPPMPVKPAYAKPSAQKTKDEAAERRAFLFGMSALAVGFVSLGAASFLWIMGVVRFMFPNVLREPPSKFTVGFPDQFPPGQVATKFKAQFGVWVVNTTYNGEQELFALKSVCTHLGCTPNWLEAEQKFKCPCHGSGFYKDGINFEGPAPRPLERYAISVADDGQVEIDKSRVFQEEMGQWSDPSSFIPA